jgi:FkbM family methyltransferase
MQKFLRNSSVARRMLLGPRQLRRHWMNYRAAPAFSAIKSMQSMIVGDVKVRVAEFDGEFVMSPQSHIFQRLAQHGEYEPELARIFLDAVQPDKDVIDVGANLGFFTCASAKQLKKGKVLAIEPTNGAYGRLIENVALNQVEERVIIFKGLASDQGGTSDIHYIEGMEEYSSIEKSVHPAVSGTDMQKISVSAKTIDELVNEHGLNPAVMKVDVEGAEGMVFKGALSVLREFRPLVLAELNREMLHSFGSSPEEIIAGFKELGYRTIDPLRPKIEPGKEDFGDLLCIPGRQY